MLLSKAANWHKEHMIDTQGLGGRHLQAYSLRHALLLSMALSWLLALVVEFLLGQL